MTAGRDVVATWVDAVNSLSRWPSLFGNLSRRAPLYQIADVSQLSDVLREIDNVRVLCMDVHPALKEWRSDWDEDGWARVANLADMLCQTSVTELILMSNGRLSMHIPVETTLNIRIFENANKPWNAAHLYQALDINSNCTVVCGDQRLTEGLLAWAWSCAFVELVETRFPRPGRVRLLDFCSKRLQPILPFRIHPGENSHKIERSG